MKNPEILILVGPPLCGKSTFCKKEEYKEYTIISRDAIILELHPDLKYTDAFKVCDQKEVDKIFKKKLFNSLADGKSIIVDKTNMASKARRKILVNVPKEYTKVAVVFNWDKKMLLERNTSRNAIEGKYIPEKVLDDMINSFVPIRYEEGFDKVISLK